LLFGISSERRISQTQCANSREPFASNSKIIRRRLAAIGKNKSVRQDSVSGDILKLSGQAMIPYLARLLDITINNATIPADLKKPWWFLFTKGVIVCWSQITDPPV
jgi:hypothetical protein